MNVTLKVLKTGEIHLCAFTEIDFRNLTVERRTLTLLAQSRVGFLEEVDFAVLLGHNYVVSERGLSMGLEQHDVSKRNLNAQTLGHVEECPGREECIVESRELVISRRYCFSETVSGNVWRLDQSRCHV